jgi:hypothetical protein
MMIAYPWHMVWFHDLYTGVGAYTRPEPDVLLGMLSMLVQGSVLAYLYPYYYRGGSSILNGVKFSLLIGVVIYSVMGFAMAAKVDINPISTYLYLNAIFQVIQFVMTGCALGFIYRNLANRRQSVVHE